MVKIGIVGLGTIGRALLRAVEEGRVKAEVSAVTSRDRKKAESFLRTLKKPPPYLDLEGLIARSDLIVEAAGADVVPSLAERVFDAGKDLLVISAGGLLERGDLIERARREGRRLYVPSGAIAGLDGLRSASAGRIDRVVMTTRKPPRGLAGAPYLVERGISLEGLKEEKVLFEGRALEACRGFPANVNVAAAVSLAGIGPERTRVRIVADPRVKMNIHDIEVEGEFGRMSIHIENVPTENPRTGRLTTLSVIAALRRITQALQVGT